MIRKLIIGLSIPVILAGLYFGWRSVTRHKLNRERAGWMTVTLPRLASLAPTNGAVTRELDTLGVWRGADLSRTWVAENVLLMTNAEFLVYASRHGFNNGFVDHLFLARGSDGRWYYSTYHFCNDMVGVRADDQPGSIAEFAKTYSAREFDGKSDECLQHTWPVKH